MLLRIDAIQHSVAERITHEIDKGIHLPLQMGSIKVRHFNKLEINDILLNDQKGDTMICVDKITLHISPLQLLRKKIRINTITLAEPDIRIHRESHDSKANIDFLLELFAGNDSTPKKEIPELKINQLQIYDGKVSYDVLSEKEEDFAIFDNNHIAISDISTNISLKKFSNDTLSLYVRNIVAKEKSGLQIKQFRAHLNASKRGLKLEKCRLRLADSQLLSDKLEAIYNWNIEENVPTDIKYSGSIDFIRINPKDLLPLIPQIGEVPVMRIKLSGYGDKNRIDIWDFIARSLNENINIEAKGGMTKESLPEYNLNVNRFDITKEGLSDITSILPQKIAELSLQDKLGDISIKGDIRTKGKEIESNVDIKTNSGNVQSSLISDKNGRYSITAVAKDVALGRILSSKELGRCNVHAKANGQFHDTKKFHGVYNCKIASLHYKNYNYKNVDIEGDFTESTVSTNIISNDNNLKAIASLEYDNTKEKPYYKAKIDVDTLRIHELGLIDTKRKQEIAFNGDIEFSEENNNSLLSVNFYNFSLTTPEKNWLIRYLHLRDNILESKRNLIIDSDILQGYVTGYYNFETLQGSFTNIIQKYLPNISTDKHHRNKTKNNFVFRFDINNTDLFSNVFGLPITINKKSTIEGNCDDSYDHIAFNAELNETDLSGRRYRQIVLDGKTEKDSIVCYTELNRSINKKKEDNDHITIRAISTIACDSIKNKISWNNTGKEVIKGDLDLDIAISKNERKGTDFSAKLKPGLVIHCDEPWVISQSNIYSKHNKFHIRNFALQNRNKEMHINGTIGEENDDCLTVDLKEIDIEELMDIVNFHSVELGGIATGNIHLSSILKTFKLNSRLNVNKFKFEYGDMGDMEFNGKWDDEHEAILLNAKIVNSNKVATYVDGFVSPAHDTLNIDIKANDTNIDFLNHMISSIVGDVEGETNGELCVRGSMGNINLYGALAPTGRLRLKPTNTMYHLAGDTLRFDYNVIAFDKFRIKDLHNNVGIINGGVYHKCLGDFTCRFDINANNLLAYYSPDFNNETFYGTAFVTGDIGLSVDSAGVFLNANVRTDRGSKFVYNSAGPTGATDNKFITFVDRKQRNTTSGFSTAETNSLFDNIISRFRLDFMIDVTPDMQLRVYTNTMTGDYIDLYGTGPINAVYDEKEGFSMKGNLDLERGTYKFTLQDIFPKEFDIRSGSTLAFNGEPFNARLNLKTIYTVPSVPLTDLSLTAERRKNVKVNCLMDITGTLAAPTLTFDLELPDGNEEERELLANATSTQEQTNMQFIYLIGIGKFYTQDYNNSNSENQSSTMMESFISSTISGQLNNMLSQITDNDNWSFSSNFTTSEKGWNSMEVEGMLSGRLLNNRLLINGNFGYRDNPLANKNFIGDFEVQWLLNKKGNISLKAYNKTNDRYFSKTTLTTQGAGILLRRDFNGWKFWKKED
ncbi:MAG: translocation/assembly module TamB domain-containing protein [Bacteroidaceae bacterium]|nr:translocation/assembly module TamB domain-containing protein [Bacteroidaceae bacterium]